MNHKEESRKYTAKDFLPIIIIGIVIISFTLIKQIAYGFNISNAMSDFMGSFFLIFSIFKIINLRGFVEAYSMYDIIAKHFSFYAYIYPFIELIFGIAYLIRYQLLIVNIMSVIIMAISSIGVAIELSKKREIVCACLGAVFKIPMTYVTLAEDVIMGIMAIIMITMNL